MRATAERAPRRGEILPAPIAERPQPAASARHIGALDGVRGLAIVLVLIHHVAGSLEAELPGRRPIFGAFQLGWCGVDLFFVLSGFLITGILCDARSRPDYFRNFYARRALRIFPLYYAVLAGTALVARWWPGLSPRESPIWLWTYATNIVISVKGFRSFGVLDHFWSLAIEEQFYLVWPFVVLRLDPRRLSAVAAGAFLAALLVRAALCVLVHPVPPAAYVLTPARVDALAAGAFVAIVVRRPEGIAALVGPARRIAAAAAAVLAMIFGARGTVRHDDPVVLVIGCSALAALFGAGLVLSLTHRPLARAFEHGALRWFGRYSYGIYVFHPIVFILVLHSTWGRAARGGPGLLPLLGALVVAAAATAAITLASYHLFEKKILDLKRHFP